MSSETQTAEMTTRQVEAEEALPHELGCFEVYAETLIEAGTAKTGEHDEILPNGRTVISLFHQEMVEGTARCWCSLDAAESDW